MLVREMGGLTLHLHTVSVDWSQYWDANPVPTSRSVSHFAIEAMILLAERLLFKHADVHYTKYRIEIHTVVFFSI